MSSFVNGGAARASAPETKPTPAKQLFVRINGPACHQLPPLQVLQSSFNSHGRVVKITSAKNGSIAFVTFTTPEDAKAALDAMNNHEVVVESNGARLVRTLFVDFALEKGTKPVHVQAPRQAPRPAYVEAPRPAYVEAPRPEPAPRPAPPQKPVLDVASANLPMVYLFPDQRPKMMSNQAMALLFDHGMSPQTKFQGDTPVQLFNGIQWVIPHPEHPYATQDCQIAYDSGNYFEKITVYIPREVLTSKKFWRD